MTALFHFDKLLQIPFIIIHNEFSLSFRELIELFITDQSEFPIVQNIYSFLLIRQKISKTRGRVLRVKEMVEYMVAGRRINVNHVVYGKQSGKFLQRSGRNY